MRNDIVLGFVPESDRVISLVFGGCATLECAIQIHRNGCNPILSDCEQVQNVRSECNRVIPLATGGRST